jgi:hypothetical protein
VTLSPDPKRVRALAAIIKNPRQPLKIRQAAILELKARVREVRELKEVKLTPAAQVTLPPVADPELTVPVPPVPELPPPPSFGAVKPSSPDSGDDTDAKWFEIQLLLLSCARLRGDAPREAALIAELDEHGIDYPGRPKPELPPAPEREPQNLYTHHEPKIGRPRPTGAIVEFVNGSWQEF